MNLKKLILLVISVIFSLTLSAGENQLQNPVPSDSDIQQNQRTRITGKVVDSAGAPLIGAYVLEKGTSNGIPADTDGSFSLDVNSGATLTVSFVGYANRDVVVGTQTSFNIVLTEDIQRLDDVVVVGYGSIARRELTSAVSQVSSRDFLAVGNNPLQAIQGKISGVSIGNTGIGDPNSQTSIQIRGVSSRSAGLGPLIVIDGVPGGNLENLNYEDVESITVLKDGAASAIYGTRGSNGVVLVTSKKGTTDGVTRTTYSGYVSFAQPIRELEVLSAEEYRAANRQDVGGNTDWFNEVSQLGIAQHHSIQVAGGNSRTNYTASANYAGSRGTDLRGTRSEVGARLAVNHTAANGLLDFSFTVSPRIIKQNNADRNVFQMALTANPTESVFNPDGTYMKLTGQGMSNPVENMKLQQAGGDRKYLDWNGTVKLNLLPLLSNSTRHFLNTNVTVAQQIRDNFSFNFTPSIHNGQKDARRTGSASRRYDVNRQESLEWLVNYGYEDGVNSLRLMGGYSYQQFVDESLNASNQNFASDALMYNNLGSGTYAAENGRTELGSSKEDSKLIGFFGRVNYSLKGKYMLTASLRREGSSKFGANHKWGNFPAVSAGWMISEENFMQGVSWIDELKIRADYGVTGNQDFSNYNSLATMSSPNNSVIVIGGESITPWGPNKNVNPDLRWEKGKNFNLGLDFVLLRGRIAGSFNYFNRRQSDLLGNYKVSVPPNVVGETFANVGTMGNSGVEIELSLEAVRTQNFNYNITFVGSTMNNKFISFSNDVFSGQKFYWQTAYGSPGNPGPMQRIEEGERVGNFVTFEYAGLDDGGGWLIYNRNGDKIPIAQGTDADKKVMGNGLPKFQASLSNNFRYKNWDLSLFFRGNFGHQIYDTHELYYGLPSLSGQNVLSIAYTKNKNITGNNIHNSYFIKNGSFVKLDVATLGWTKEFDGKMFKGSIRIYFTGRNLFTIKGYDLDADSYSVNGLEPGVPATGTGNPGKMYYPASRQYLLGVRFNF